MTFDLVGALVRQSDQDQFIAEMGQDAYDKLVDDLVDDLLKRYPEAKRTGVITEAMVDAEIARVEVVMASGAHVQPGMAR